MLDYKLINRKPTIKKDNGESYIDLLPNSYDAELIMRAMPIIVNKHYVARPDLISLSIYGDDSYGDIICKINGIPNPFELNEDMVLIMPDVEYVKNCLLKTIKPSELIKDPKTDSIYQSHEFNMQKRKNEDRSPNEQLVGESNYVIDKSLGVIFY